MTLDELWTAGLNDDQHRSFEENKLARLQAWVREHCQKPVVVPARKKTFGIF